MSTFYLSKDRPNAGVHLEMISVSRDDNTIRASFEGEIDFSNADRFRAMVLALLATTAQPSVGLDLDRVGLVDSAGARALMFCWDKATLDGRMIVVRNAQPIVRRMLGLLGVLAVLVPD
jgi:anti-anti-sigma factor